MKKHIITLNHPTIEEVIKLLDSTKDIYIYEENREVGTIIDGKAIDKEGETNKYDLMNCEVNFISNEGGFYVLQIADGSLEDVKLVDINKTIEKLENCCEYASDIKNYTSLQYTHDVFCDIADSNVTVSRSGVGNYIAENLDLVEETLDEFGYNDSLLQAVQLTQFNQIMAEICLHDVEMLQLYGLYYYRDSNNNSLIREKWLKDIMKGIEHFVKTTSDEQLIDIEDIVIRNLAD